MDSKFPRTFQESYLVTSPLTNPMGYLGLYGVLNLMQDTAWLHASRIGFGQNQMLDEGLIWVYTRQRLQMTEWPRWGSRVNVQTWVLPPSGAFVPRNFVITDESGKEIGSSTASFLALDQKTRKILPAADLRPWQDLVHDRTLDVVAEKLPVQGDYERLAKFRVRNSDLDGNQHVNNTKYAQWILDAVPFELHKNYKLTGYSVNFLAETHLGDELEVYSGPKPEITELSGQTAYKGLRKEDGKVLFTAQLDWTQRS